MGDIDRYDADLDRIVQESFRAEAPDVLYHYTPWAGAEGILSSMQFRFMAHDCTNDPAELISADPVAIEVGSALRAKAAGSTAKLLDLLLTDYQRLLLAKARKMVQQDRAAEYIDSPMMTQRLRLKKQLSARIDGRYGTYRIQVKLRRRIDGQGGIEVQRSRFALLGRDTE